MTFAKLAYLTTPSPGVFVFNYQIEGSEIQRVEISKAHLINILIDGTAVALRESSASQNGVPHEHQKAIP